MITLLLTNSEAALIEQLARAELENAPRSIADQPFAARECQNILARLEIHLATAEGITLFV